MASDKDPENPEDSADEKSKVSGVLQQIEEAELAALGLHCNHTVLFAGVICPIICEEESRVKILHGNTEIWLSRDVATKVLGTKTKEKQPKWTSLSQNPLVQPHRK